MYLEFVLERAENMLNGENATQPSSIAQVSGVKDLRTGDRWFSQYTFRGLMIVIARGFTPLNAVHFFGNGYVGK